METALSVALVGLVAILATSSLGGGVSATVNKVTRVLNPSLLANPEVLADEAELSLITGQIPSQSKTGAVQKDNNPGRRPQKPSRGL